MDGHRRGAEQEPLFVIWIPKLLHFTITYTGPQRALASVIPRAHLGAVDFCLSPRDIFYHFEYNTAKTQTIR